MCARTTPPRRPASRATTAPMARMRPRRPTTSSSSACRCSVSARPTRPVLSYAELAKEFPNAPTHIEQAVARESEPRRLRLRHPPRLLRAWTTPSSPPCSRRSGRSSARLISRSQSPAAPTAWRCACWPSVGRKRPGGMVTALIVDHGLRPESGTEAREVATWLARRGIRHRILVWRGPKPATGIQAAARDARYALLTDWCRAAGALHLLLGHHGDDQAETIALRAARRSGPDGLAGMAPVREIAGLRLLRPLLRRARSSACSRPFAPPASRGSRTRATSRRDLPARGCAKARLACPQPTPTRTPKPAPRSIGAPRPGSRRWPGSIRQAIVSWPRKALAEAPPEIARRALQQALAAVGGGAYPPRSARLDRLLEDAAGGIRLRRPDARRVPGPVPWRDDLLICREPAAIAPPLPLAPNVWQHWDRRFLVRWQASERCGAGADRAGARRRRLARLQGSGIARRPCAACRLPCVPGWRRYGGTSAWWRWPGSGRSDRRPGGRRSRCVFDRAGRLPARPSSRPRRSPTCAIPADCSRRYLCFDLTTAYVKMG